MTLCATSFIPALMLANILANKHAQLFLLVKPAEAQSRPKNMVSREADFQNYVVRSGAFYVY
jgi:hypothetical protein